MKELAGHLIVPLSPEIVATSRDAGLPGLAGKFHSTVGKKRIIRNVVLLLLPKHHVHGVVQHHVGNTDGRLRHEHSGVGFTSGQIGQCADMILMGVGDNDIVDLVSGISWKFGVAASPSFFGCMPLSRMMDFPFVRRR